MKKTEEELKQEIVEEYGFEEDDERIDKVLEIKKDKYTAIQQKKRVREDLEKMEKGKDYYKKQLPKKGVEAKATDTAKEATLSVKDSAYLQQADVPVDDWDEVIDYATFKGISIRDALKNSVVKTTLAGRKEERATAQATNAGKGKRGSSRISGSKLLQKANEKGEIPDSDAELDAMLEERYSR